jgi:dolichol kinase
MKIEGKKEKQKASEARSASIGFKIWKKCKYRKCLRKCKSQGIYEGLLISVILSCALYVKEGDLQIFIRIFLPLLLITFKFINFKNKFMDLIQKYYALIYLFILALWHVHKVFFTDFEKTIGCKSENPPTFVQKTYFWYRDAEGAIFGLLNIHFYFVMLEGMKKTFTAAELLINTQLITTITKFSLYPFLFKWDSSVASLFEENEYPNQFTLKRNRLEDDSFLWISVPTLLCALTGLLYSLNRFKKRSKKYMNPLWLFSSLLLSLSILLSSMHSPLLFSSRTLLSSLFSLLFTPKSKLFLLAFWVFLILLSIISFYGLQKSLKLSLIPSRKLYHALTLFLFTPGFLISAPLMLFSFNVVLSMFLLLEGLRIYFLQSETDSESITEELVVWRWVRSSMRGVSKYFRSFTYNECEFCMSHLSLLWGCALPLQIVFLNVQSEGVDGRWLFYSLCGVVFLGGGDAVSGVMGSRYGVKKWKGGGSKTYFGSLCCVLVMLILNVFFMSFLLSAKLLDVVCVFVCFFNFF